MNREYKLASITSALLLTVLVMILTLSLTPSASAADNVTPGTPEVVGIQADDNMVNRWGDNVKITFQIYDDNGINDVKSVEIWIKNESNATENYDNWPGGNVEVVKNISHYENEYSFTFNPENSFDVGWATVKIRATDNAGLENTVWAEDLFRVTDETISVTTKDADGITENSAVLHASIDFAGYDKVEACFYYENENESDHATWENHTSWENTSETDYERTISELAPEENYEFMASIRLPANNPDGASQWDNGSILKFTTLPENIPASVETTEATEVQGGSAKLNAKIGYGDYGTVEVIFYYKKELEGWENTGWENVSVENYSRTIRDLPPGKIYEFYPKIKYGSNEYDNGSILSFDSGQVLLQIGHDLEVETDDTGDIDITVINEYDNLQLRNVIITPREDRYPRSSVTIDTIQANSSDSVSFKFNPSTPGEQKLGFSVDYRVYDENDYLFSRRIEGETSILVTGPEYENAIALRIASESATKGKGSAPNWIFDGETYIAQIEIQNQRSAPVTGIRIVIENCRDYGVGTLQGDESEIEEIRIPPEMYELGATNEYMLRAIHERGVSPPLTIKFRVRPENAPVGVYMTRSNTPIHEGQELEFTIVIAAAPGSEAKNLEILALSENVIPDGYYLGEEMKNLVQAEISTAELGQALMPMPSFEVEEGGEEEEEEEKGAVIGRALNFRAMNLRPGDNALKFQIIYELGNRLVKREFEVDFEVYGSPGVKLIQAEKVTAIRGEVATISLEVANGLSVEIKSVRIVPLENSPITPTIPITPTLYWIGTMSPNDFYPVEFDVDTSELEGGDNLTFQVVYEVGNKVFYGDTATVEVNLKKPSRNLTPYYTVSGIIVLLLLILYWRRR